MENSAPSLKISALQSGCTKNVTVTLLEFILQDWQKSPRGVLRSMFVPQAAVKRKQ